MFPSRINRDKQLQWLLQTSVLPFVRFLVSISKVNRKGYLTHAQRRREASVSFMSSTSAKTRQHDYTHRREAGSISGPGVDRPTRARLRPSVRLSVRCRPHHTTPHHTGSCQDRRWSRLTRADSCMLMFALRATSCYLLSLDIARHSWTEQLRTATRSVGRSANRLHLLQLLHTTTTTGSTPSHHARPRCLSLCALWVKHVSTWEEEEGGGGREGGGAGRAEQERG